MAEPAWLRKLLQLALHGDITAEEKKEVLNAYCGGQIDEDRLEVMMEDPEQAASRVKRYYNDRDLRELQNNLLRIQQYIIRKRERNVRLRAQLQLTDNGAITDEEQVEMTYAFVELGLTSDQAEGTSATVLDKIKQALVKADKDLVSCIEEGEQLKAQWQQQQQRLPDLCPWLG